MQAVQGHEAADVEVPGFWIECGHGGSINPRVKLTQALEAEQRHFREIPGAEHLVAIAVTRVTGSREVIVTLRLEDLLELLGAPRVSDPIAVQLRLADFLGLVERLPIVAP